MGWHFGKESTINLSWGFRATAEDGGITTREEWPEAAAEEQIKEADVGICAAA